MVHYWHAAIVRVTPYDRPPNGVLHNKQQLPLTTSESERIARLIGRHLSQQHDRHTQVHCFKRRAYNKQHLSCNTIHDTNTNDDDDDNKKNEK